LLACSPALSGTECSSKWLLRLASAAAFATPSGRSEADRTDLTVLAGIGMRLWLSQDPSGSAGQRAIVRIEQSLATDETCRDKGSGWVPEPAGT